MELKEVLKNISNIDISDNSVEELLKEFGDFLREDSIRASFEAKTSILAVIKIANDKFTHILQKKYSATEITVLLEALRVLINFSANNDDNRKFLASTDLGYKDTFWALTRKTFSSERLSTNLINLYERILLLLSQFIHNTELLNEFSTFFREINMDKCLLAYLKFRIDLKLFVEIGFSDLLIPTELYLEFTNEISEDKTLANTYTECLAAIISVFNFALGLNIDEDDEDEMETINDVYSNLSQIIYNITSCEDIPNISSTQVHPNILKLIPKLPTKILNCSLNKRRLFSSSGNISSMTNYDNFSDISMILKYFHDPQTDPYILSACAINLGNYVNSIERADLLIGKIESEISLKAFVANFYNIKFNDVIQYQAFHLFNNLMTCDIALYSLENYDSLLKSTKVIFDNSQYYKEVFNIYAKFVKKLIRFAFIENKGRDLSMFQFKELWNHFNPLEQPGSTSEEVYLILTQAFIATRLLETGSLDSDNIPFVSILLENLVSESNFNNQVSFTFLAEKLKTLGIFFKTITNHNISGDVITEVLYSSSSDQYSLRFVAPYYKFLQKLKKVLAQEPDSNSTNSTNQFNIIQNNSKFVCATTLAYFNLPHENDETIEAIHAICQSILR